MKAHIHFERSADFTDSYRSDRSRQNSSKWWQQYADKAIRFLSGNHEPIIHQTQTADGQPVWVITDPITSTRQTFGSEAEVRFWLEQRYQN
jgi:hypothetical protein